MRAPRSWAGVGAGLIVAVLAAACAAPGSAAPAAGAAGTGSGSSGPTTSAAASTGLGGRTFLSEHVVGHTLVAGSRISLSFEQPGQLHAQAGCNSMSGAVDTADGRLTTSGLASTEMGCDAALMQQDTWFADLLAAGPAWNVDGDTLTMTSGDTVVTLIDRRVADPDRPLEGTTWQLDGLIDGDAASSVPSGVRATLSIKDGHLAFSAGCNTYNGDGTFDGAAVRVTAMSGTDAGCSDSRGEVEQVMSAVLRDFTYRISAGSLTVNGKDGKGLTFIAADAAATPAAVHPTPTPTSMLTPTTSAPSAADPLPGRTFVLTRLFTDAGGSDTRLPGATFRITFGRHDATAVSQCGIHHYRKVTVGGGTGMDSLGIRVRLGTPTGPACNLGTDPAGIPSGELHFGGSDKDGYYLSTGYVAWYFDEVTR